MLKKRQSKKGLPIWSDGIAAAVHRSKVAHLVWKRAGCSKNPGDPSFQERKVVRNDLRKEVRYTLFQQRQDLLKSVMEASERDLQNCAIGW